jgi:arsenite-transporting ATPase
VTPMMRLQDPEQTRILIVTLAETTPVLEASGLQDDLRRAGIEPWGWIINASLAATDTAHPLLRSRATAEREQIEGVEGGIAKRVAVVPMLAEEPVGVGRLAALMKVGSASGAGASPGRESLLPAAASVAAARA